MLLIGLGQLKRIFQSVTLHPAAALQAADEDFLLITSKNL